AVVHDEEREGVTLGEAAVGPGRREVRLRVGERGRGRAPDVVSFGHLDRQLHGEGGAPTWLRLHPQLAAEEIAEALGDGQPEPRAPVFPCGALVCLIKW